MFVHWRNWIKSPKHFSSSLEIRQFVPFQFLSKRFRNRVLDFMIPPWRNESTLDFFFKSFLFETYHIKAHDLAYLASFRNIGFRQQNSRYHQVKDRKFIIGWIVKASKFHNDIHNGQLFQSPTIMVESFGQGGIMKSGTLSRISILSVSPKTTRGYDVSFGCQSRLAVWESTIRQSDRYDRFRFGQCQGIGCLMLRKMEWWDPWVMAFKHWWIGLCSDLCLTASDDRELQSSEKATQSKQFISRHKDLSPPSPILIQRMMTWENPVQPWFQLLYRHEKCCQRFIILRMAFLRFKQSSYRREPTANNGKVTSLLLSPHRSSIFNGVGYIKLLLRVRISLGKYRFDSFLGQGRS
jgi:hypothetical protein